MSTTDDQVLAELPLPDTTQPAAADPATQVQFAVCAKRVAANRTEPLNIGFVAVVLTIVGLCINAPAPRVIVIGFGGLVLFGWLGWYARAAMQYDHRWWSAAREQLTHQPWRAVAVAPAGRLIEPRDGSLDGYVRVTGLGEAERRLIARTGRVWVVGPDPAGWLTVRLDGAPCFYPARLVPPRTGRPVPKPTPTSGRGAGTAAADPVTVAYAKTWVRIHIRWLCAVGLYALAATLFAMLLDRWVPLLILLLMLPPLLLPVVIRIHLFYRVRTVLALPRLMRTGAWTPVAVTLRPWRAGPGGLSAGITGTIYLDHGGMVEFVLPVAAFDLLATISSTGTMWLVGQPQPGRTTVVGFPGYPMLGWARLT